MNTFKVLFISMILFSLSSCERLTFKKADGIAKEDCKTLGEISLVKNENDIWQLNNDDSLLYYFPTEEEALETKDKLNYYKATSLCECGKGPATFENGEENGNATLMLYQLTEDGTGIGNSEENSYGNDYEDCLPFNPESLVAKKVGGNWTIVEKPGHLMFSFDDDKQACYDALNIIKKYNFTQSCFIGRPNPSFHYLKRYRTDLDPIR